MAAFLYLGAGVGLLLYSIVSNEKEKGAPLTVAEWPYTLGMVVLDIIAPILLMLGERPAVQCPCLTGCVVLDKLSK